MINAGTVQLLQRNGIFMQEYQSNIPDWAEGLLISGGGNIGKIWDFSSLRRDGFDQAERRGLRIVILPQSIFAVHECIPFTTVVFVRERESLNYFPDSKLAPDMSFALTTDIPLPAPQARRGVFMRSDQESVFGMPTGTDPTVIAKTWPEYIELAAKHEEIITDRLHFAVAALLAERKTTLLPNSYHKNESMWDTWLRDMGCAFEHAPL